VTLQNMLPKVTSVQVACRMTYLQDRRHHINGSSSSSTDAEQGFRSIDYDMLEVRSGMERNKQHANM
jgi:hypothetical protein